MPKSFVGTLFAIALLSPIAAYAAVYSFSSSETSALGNPSYAFDIDTSTGVASGGGTYFPDVTISEDGKQTTGNTIYFPFLTELDSSLFSLVDTDVPGPKLFGSGSGPSVTFNPGVYSIADRFTNGEGTLTISGPGVSAIPEPSTWLIMLVGFGGVGVTLRRKVAGDTAPAGAPTT